MMPKISRDVLVKLLGQYHRTFPPREVDALLSGRPLKSTADPTLLDIEQSINPSMENWPPLETSGSSGNDNTE